MTREEIERIGVGDLNAMAKLAATIKPLEKSGQTAGPIVRQFMKTTVEETQARYGSDQLPDFLEPGGSIASRRPQVFQTPRSVTSNTERYGPVPGYPFTVEVTPSPEEPYALSGDYRDARDQLSAYERECAARFRETVMQLYPTLPELWMLPPPQGMEAPRYWGIGDGVVRETEARLKAGLLRVASDTSRSPAVRKAASDAARGLDVADPRFRAAIKQHVANAALRQAVANGGAAEIKARREALQGIIDDDAVPRAVRADAQRELQSLGV